MASPPNLSTTHAAGQTILSADIDDIAAGVNSSVQIGSTLHTRSKTNILFNPTGTFPLTAIPIWRVPYPITVTAIYVYRVGGTGATINVRKVAGTTPSNMLSSNYSLTVEGPPWVSTGALVGAPSTVFATGNSLEVVFASIAGTPGPTLLAVQIDYTENVA